MFSELAKNDLLRLREQGYSPTDEEIIALNDLAVQIENGKETTIANHPRFAYAGNVVFHEPTVGALEWWWEYGLDAAWTMKGQLHTHFFMLAHARDVELLQSLTTPKSINKAVKIWLKGVAATDDEMLRAMLYVKHGLNWIVPTEKVEETNQDEVLEHLHTLMILASGSLGISTKDLQTRTQSQLMGMLRVANKSGMNLKPSIAKQYIAYQQMIRKIEERGTNNGNEPRIEA